MSQISEKKRSGIELMAELYKEVGGGMVSQISEKERSGIELMAELYKEVGRGNGEPNQREGAERNRSRFAA